MWLFSFSFFFFFSFSFCQCATCLHLLATGMFKTHVGTHPAQPSYFMGGGTEKFRDLLMLIQQAQRRPEDSQAWGIPHLSCASGEAKRPQGGVLPDSRMRAGGILRHTISVNPQSHHFPHAFLFPFSSGGNRGSER